jgi:hypothetical protein
MTAPEVRGERRVSTTPPSPCPSILVPVPKACGIKSRIAVCGVVMSKKPVVVRDVEVGRARISEDTAKSPTDDMT